VGNILTSLVVVWECWVGLLFSVGWWMWCCGEDVCELGIVVVGDGGFAASAQFSVKGITSTRLSLHLSTSYSGRILT
jgi:hypothetical protein